MVKLSKKGSAKTTLSWSLFPKGKRGVEQPQTIVYVFVVVIQVIIGIYVAFTFLGGVDIKLQFQDYAARLNAAGSQLIHSPDCFAVEATYQTAIGVQKQVSAGIIDWNKFNDTETLPQRCIIKDRIWARLEIFDFGSDITWNNQEPSAAELADPDQWVQTERNFYVLVLKDNAQLPGKLTLRLKE
jgi:hypothetical protein